ncbi:MAG: DUF3187 family protein [Deltaproteobacteria bacterium]|nr:DUF3187 family protein [Deltaproteobacteria bacterium]
MFRRILLAALVLIPISVFAEPSQFRGPIELGNQYPFALMQPSMRPRRAQIEESGHNLFSFTSAWSNSAIRKDHYTIDDETVVMEAAARHGLSEQWEVGFLLPFRTEGGGVLDPFINGWHRTFGLPRGDRPHMPDDKHNVSGEDSDGEFDFGKTGFGLGTPELSTRYCFNPTLCSGLTIGLPAPSIQYGQQGVALGTDVVQSIDFTEFSFSYGGALWFYGDTSIDNVEYRPLVPNGFAVLEYAYDSIWNFYCAFWGGLQSTEDIQGHPDSQWYLDVGARIRIANETSLDIMLRENPYPGSGTTDVSMVLGLTYRN